MSKKCICCGGVDIKQNGSYADGSKSFECRNCGEVFILQTVFHHITASPEILAEKLVYAVHYGGLYFWHSTLIYPAFPFETKAEAIAATVDRLKEVAK
jgi:hypothetical protein